MFMQPNEWRKSFENKTEWELEELMPPPGLPPVFLKMWRRDRVGALARLQQPGSKPEGLKVPEDEEEIEEEQQSFSKEKDALEAALTALENDTSGDRTAPKIVLSPFPLEIPQGNAADLLEQQDRHLRRSDRQHRQLRRA